MRYIGHANEETDIKEASFMGSLDEYVVAGSDDGRAFVWERASGVLLRVIKADEDIVNCVQAHPYDTVLATSGIEPTVKLWLLGGREWAHAFADRGIESTVKIWMPGG
ncbi:hypothetical protein T484DRAFT_1795066 [Baffinella frigidus]|nr:hypothetical protein T484DRAFT_1795066 [Cryptophyta sp. CCMP2293]